MTSTFGPQLRGACMGLQDEVGRRCPHRRAARQRGGKSAGEDTGAPPMSVVWLLAYDEFYEDTRAPPMNDLNVWATTPRSMHGADDKWGAGVLTGVPRDSAAERAPVRTPAPHL